MPEIEGDRAGPARRTPRDMAPRRRELALAADEGGTTVALGCPLPEGVDGVALAGPQALDPVLLATLEARQVICPLVGDGFDALAVALRLAQLGYGGPLVVLAPPLPNPRMVAREIRNQSGGMQVRVVTRG